MRIVGLVLLVSLLATLGLLACLAPVTPVAPAPAATATPAPTLSRPADIPTATPMPTPRPGATPISSVTKTYIDLSLAYQEKLDLKAGNIVVFTVTTTAEGGIIVDVDAPTLPPALMPQLTRRGETGKYSFRAAMDGTYRVTIGQDMLSQYGYGFGYGAATVIIDIYGS